VQALLQTMEKLKESVKGVFVKKEQVEVDLDEQSDIVVKELESDSDYTWYDITVFFFIFLVIIFYRETEEAKSFKTN
jgi:hypothetical protein